jgi:hypothetical protein
MKMATEVIYGFFHGGDPREFSPDDECCSPDEIRRHKAACDLWNEAERKGITPTPEACPSGWEMAPDGTQVHVLRAPYGIGTYTVEFGDDDFGDEDAEPRIDPLPGQRSFWFPVVTKVKRIRELAS